METLIHVKMFVIADWNYGISIHNFLTDSHKYVSILSDNI